MKNKITAITILLLISVSTRAQRFGFSRPCEFNVYDPSTSGSTRQDCINATFKFSNNASICTGTLINRNTTDGNLGFYFVTAWHCFNDWDGGELDFFFNYQSKDEFNSSVPPSNQGWQSWGDNGQSNLYDDGLGLVTNNDDYQYHHRSQVREVASFAFGDFKLFEILTPIPPHFNVTFSGWNPSSFRYLSSIGQFASIHHPRGDIKKNSQASLVVWQENPIATGCYTVTKMIDVLVGWIWRRRWSTSVICKYVTSPWFTVPHWDKGAVEHGSSGAGMFSTNNRLFGTLSGDPLEIKICSDIVFEPYGKLFANYPAASVKNTLNPEGGPEPRVWIDLLGMPSRKITCYPTLNLPGASGVSGEYFPAGDYQADNKIALQASSTITTSQPINIYAQSDYTFRAGNSVSLNPGFDARPESVFTAEIGGCQSSNGSNQRKVDFNTLINKMLQEIKIPKSKEFDMNKYVKGDIIQSDVLFANIFPNPNNGSFEIKISAVGDYEVMVTNLLGQVIYKANILQNDRATVQLARANAGHYIVHISNSTDQFVGKILVTD